MVCAITPYGSTGPYANWRGYALQAYAGSGVAFRVGDPEREPLTAPFDQAELQHGGLHAAAAVALALVHRDRSGRGQFVDISVLEAVTFGTLAEVQRFVVWGVHGVRSVWSGYVSLQDVREENVALRETVAQLELRLQQQNALAQRAHGLQQLLELRESIDLLTLSAQVIAADAIIVEFA